MMDRGNVIYHTVDADADRDGPGSNQGRTQFYLTRIKVPCSQGVDGASVWRALVRSLALKLVRWSRWRCVHSSTKQHSCVVTRVQLHTSHRTVGVSSCL